MKPNILFKVVFSNHLLGKVNVDDALIRILHSSLAIFQTFLCIDVTVIPLSINFFLKSDDIGCFFINRYRTPNSFAGTTPFKI